MCAIGSTIASTSHIVCKIRFRCSMPELMNYSSGFACWKRFQT